MILLSKIAGCVVGSMARQHIRVYNGLGAEAYKLEKLLSKLRNHLSADKYTVTTITAEETIQGDWMNDTAVYTIGGGYDLGFIQALGQKGTLQIRDYVRSGGKYLGICAGAYFACDSIEFDKGGPQEVCGERHLKFFPGVCVGPVYGPYNYQSKISAQAATIEYKAKGEDRLKFPCFFNGGGMFVPFQQYCTSKIHKIPQIYKHKLTEKTARNIKKDLEERHVLSLDVDSKDEQLDTLQTSNSCNRETVGYMGDNSIIPTINNDVLSDKTAKSHSLLSLEKGYKSSINGLSKDFLADANCSKILEVLGQYGDIVGNPICSVKCGVHQGTAVLTSFHPEFNSQDLDHDDPFLQPIIEQLSKWDHQADWYFNVLLKQLGLNTSI